MNTRSKKEASDNDTVSDSGPQSKKRPSDDDTVQGLEPPPKTRTLDDDDASEGLETPSQKRPSDDNVQRPSSSEVEDSGKVSGVVFYVGDLYSYYRNGNKCTEFPVLLINHTDCYRLRVFNETLHATFSSNQKKPVEIDNIKLKNDCIFVSSKSSIEKIVCFIMAPSEDMELKAERMKEEYEPSGFTKIGSIKEANKRFNTKAKIIQMFPKETRFPVQAYKYIPIYLRTIKIADDTGVVDFTLWEDAAERTFENGQILKIEKAFTRPRPDGSVFLAAHSYTDIQVMQRSDPLYEVAMEESAHAPSITGEIEDIGEVSYYQACPGCFHSKQARDSNCKWCGFMFRIRPPIIGITCNVSVRVGEDSKDLTLFNADVRRLLCCMFPTESFTQSSHMTPMLKSHTAETLKAKMLKELPLAVHLTSKGEDALIIEKVRGICLHDMYMAL